MKAYGKKRSEEANRTIRGTSRPCPCCQRVNPNCDKTTRALRKRERRRGKKACYESQ